MAFEAKLFKKTLACFEFGNLSWLPFVSDGNATRVTNSHDLTQLIAVNEKMNVDKVDNGSEYYFRLNNSMLKDTSRSIALNL